MRGADVIVGWWASWHTFLPFTLAWLLRKPSLLIVGGFDTAAEPEFGYGFQLGGPRAWLSRFTMRRARILMTNSEYSRAARSGATCGIPADRVRVVYHGVPDEAPPARREAAARADGRDRRYAPTSSARACAPFVEAAAHAARGRVRRRRQASTTTPPTSSRPAPPRTCGSQAGSRTMSSQTSSPRAAVYVQASKHEGFGVSVAEAMLARCVPVVTPCRRAAGGGRRHRRLLDDAAARDGRAWESARRCNSDSR